MTIDDAALEQVHGAGFQVLPPSPYPVRVIYTYRMYRASAPTLGIVRSIYHAVRKPFYGVLAPGALTAKMPPIPTF